MAANNDEKRYTASEAAQILDVTKPTVRNYSERFADLLSPSARPEAGPRCEFTYQDLEIMWIARQLLADQLTYNDTKEELTPVDVQVPALLERFGPPPVDKLEAEEAEEPATGTAMINMAQFRALIAPLESAAAEWRELAESCRRENEELRSEVRRLREELREAEKREEETKGFWDRLLGR